MNYLYGWSWHESGLFPVKEITEEEARRVFETGPQLGVAAGENLAHGVVPAYSLEMNAHAEDVRVNHYTPEGSIEAILDYGTVDGRLFLDQVTEDLYPDDGEFHEQDECKALRMYSFKPDGYAKLRTRIKEADAGSKLEEFTGVDVSDHWLDPIDWGEWDRIGSYLPNSTEAPGA